MPTILGVMDPDVVSVCCDFGLLSAEVILYFLNDISGKSIDVEMSKESFNIERSAFYSRSSRFVLCLCSKCQWGCF